MKCYTDGHKLKLLTDDYNYILTINLTKKQLNKIDEVGAR